MAGGGPAGGRAAANPNRTRAGEPIVYLLLTVVSVVANFLHFASFGLYEDDWWYLAPAWQSPPGPWFRGMWHSMKTFYVGRPLQECLLWTAGYLGAAFQSLQPLYLIAAVLYAVSVLMAYRMLRLRYTPMLAGMAALLFAISPLTTIRPYLDGTLWSAPGLALLFAAIVIYARRRFVAVSYILATASLLIYEPIFILFLAAPFFRRGRKTWRQTALHLILCGLIMAGYLVVRRMAAESRLSAAADETALHVALAAVEFALYNAACSFLSYLYAVVIALRETGPANLIGSLILTAISVGWLLRSQLAMRGVRESPDAHSSPPRIAGSSATIPLSRPYRVRQSQPDGTSELHPPTSAAVRPSKMASGARRTDPVKNISGRAQPRVTPSRIRRRRNCWFLTRVLAPALGMLVLGYALSYFSSGHRMVYPLIGRDTRFSLAAVAPSSLLVAGLACWAIAMCRRPWTRRAAAGGAAALYLSCFVYSFIIQDDYRREWTHMRRLFANIVKLTPDAGPDTLLIIDRPWYDEPLFPASARRPSINFQNQGLNIGFTHLYDPYTGPKLFVVYNDQWRTRLAPHPDGKLYWTEPDFGGSQPDIATPVERIILLKESGEGNLERADTPFSVAGRELILARTAPTAAPAAWDSQPKTRLWPYVLAGPPL